MRERRYVSTQQVSCALGVSVTTVKRWVDDGTLPAQRTVGGHRKILRDDVLRLVREGNWPHVDLALLGGSLPSIDSLDAAQLTGRLYDALTSGDQVGARALLEGACQAGVSLERLADEVISPAMVRVGHGWEKGDLDVFQEHRGTQACLSALLAFAPKLAGAGEGERPVAIGGGPERDHYVLANRLAEMVLLEHGWDAINIGPNTPLASFREALRDLRPRLLWLSVSYLADAEAFLTEYGELYEAAERAGVAVAVGGRALVEPVRSRMRYTTFGDGMTHLAAFARELHPGRPKEEN